MNIDDRKLYCYLRGSITRIVLDDDVFLDAFIKLLEVPGKLAHLRRLSLKEKQAVVEQQVAHLATIRASQWNGIEAAEIVAAHMMRVVDRKGVPIAFGAVKKEADLLRPVVDWLANQDGFTVFKEIPMGRSKVDVFGYRTGGFFRSDVAIAAELKNDIEQLKRGLDQMTTFCEYAHRVYMACTPLMAAEYLKKHVEARTVVHWDPDLLNNKLRKVGLGLLIVRDDEVEEVIAPKHAAPNERKFQEVLRVIQARPIAVR